MSVAKSTQIEMQLLNSVSFFSYGKYYLWTFCMQLGHLKTKRREQRKTKLDEIKDGCVFFENVWIYLWFLRALIPLKTRVIGQTKWKLSRKNSPINKSQSVCRSRNAMKINLPGPAKSPPRSTETNLFSVQVKWFCCNETLSNKGNSIIFVTWFLAQ